MNTCEKCGNVPLDQWSIEDGDPCDCSEETTRQFYERVVNTHNETERLKAERMDEEARKEKKLNRPVDRTACPARSSWVFACGGFRRNMRPIGDQ